MLTSDLKFGQESSEVKELQELLIAHGFQLPRFGADGIFLEETQAAVKSFQSANGQEPTGVVNAQTRAALQDIAEGATLPQNAIRLKSPAAALDEIDPAFIRALIKIESGGNPAAIRFEPHLFKRLTGIQFPSDKTDKQTFYMAFSKNKEAAIRSTSFGYGQVLGGILLDISPNPDEAINSFFANPHEISIELILRWLDKNPKAKDKAKQLDFKGFAKLYNGPQYYKNNYDERLLTQYKLEKK